MSPVFESPAKLSSAELNPQIEAAQLDLAHAQRRLDAAEADAVAAAGAGEALGGKTYLAAQSAANQASEDVQSIRERLRRLQSAHDQACDHERALRIHALAESRREARDDQLQASSQFTQYQKTGYWEYRKKLETLEKTYNAAVQRLRIIDSEIAQLSRPRRSVEAK